MRSFFTRSLALLVLAFGLAFANITVTSDTTQRHALPPGAVFEGAVSIRNSGSAPTSVRVYPTDYLFDAEGRTRFDPIGSHARSNGDWYELTGSSTLQLEPSEEGTLTYRGRVPQDGSLVGTYWSVLMVEEIQDAATPDEEAVGVQIVNRRAVQIVTELGNGATPLLAFSNPTVRADGVRILQVDVANEGTQLVTPTVSLELFDADGQAEVVVEGTEKRLYPGTSTRITFDLMNVPAGEYQALVIADAGEDDLFGVRYTLTLPSE